MSYECKIASLDEVKKECDNEIKIHPNDNRWIAWKKETMELVGAGYKICYYGLLDGKIISEASAIINKNADIQNKESLIGEKRAYLLAFRTISNYRGKGYFSKLYKFMEKDLKNRGFEELTLGVEPCEETNFKIYTKWGFTNFIKSGYEVYPPKSDEIEQEKVKVNYYLKKLK